MKTTLILAILTAAHFAARAQTQTVQTAPSRIAPVAIPSHIDPTRFRQFDANQDGKLDLQEQEAERAARPADEAKRRAQVEQFRKTMAEQKRQADLNRFDANKDGVLDATERKARDRWYAERQQEHIKKHDRNGNGKIDPEEIRSLVPSPNPPKPKP